MRLRIRLIEERVMGEVVKLRPDNEVNYHMTGGKIEGVSIDSGFNRFYLGITDEYWRT